MSWIEHTAPNFKGLDIGNLKIDQCFINITSQLSEKVFLYVLSDDCDRCPYTKLQKISSNLKENVIKMDTSSKFQLKVFSEDLGQYAFDNETSLCHIEPDVGEFGVYDIIIKRSNECSFIVAKEPVSIYLPLLVIACMLVVLTLLIKIYCNYVDRSHNDVSETSPSDNEMEVPKPKKRLKSLDVFRGIAIVVMIFVNSGGGKYSILEHATWNGLHLADVVFPFFLFIMGVCIPISLISQINRNVNKKQIMLRILKRSIILFAIGFCLNTTNGSSFSKVRIFGVLQRFGIAYICVSVIHLQFMTQLMSPETRLQKLFYDIKVLLKQWYVILGIVAIYLVFIFGVPVPGCYSTGYLGPGGIHEYLKYFNCTGGFAGFFDRLVLREGHMYQRARIRSVYNTDHVFDPEGVFGCLMTIVQVFLGLQCGTTIIVYPTFKERARRFILWALGLGFLAGVLCMFSINDGLIPINKNLWSLSYVCITASLAYFLLLICYYLVDIKEIWSGAPFLYAGMNAILLYVGHMVFHKMFPFHFQLVKMNTHFISTIENIYTVLIWILVSYILFKKKKFYSI